jgi:cell division protein FtsI/penicillin-binding protein 2
MTSSDGVRSRAFVRRRAIGGVTLLALLIAGCGKAGNTAQTDPAKAAGVTFLTDWAAGNLTAAAALTTDPTAAQTALDDLQSRMGVDSRVFTPGAKTGCSGGQPCTLAFGADLHLKALGHWNYTGSLGLVERDEANTKHWLVSWAPSVIHPQLTTDTMLKRDRTLPDRAPILDRYGAPLVTNQTVIKIGVKAGSVPDGTISKLSDALNLDVDGLTIRTNEAKEGDFVEAAVLRQSDYDAVSAKLDAIDGVLTQKATQALAPTREFAREVLGAVATATAQSLANAGDTASPADAVGTFGLQASYQKQLAGRPSGDVVLANRSTGKTLATLATFVGAPGIPVHTTLDATVQQAADAALKGTTENSSLVAIDIRNGDILAVANGPGAKAGDDRALDGRYAPGSTFKIVTSEALLHNGLKLTDTVACPPDIVVNGKKFSNYDGLGSMGDVAFERDFTESCNTAFIGAAQKLNSAALVDAAGAFGVHGSWDLGIANFSGDVPPPNSPEEQAADAIGQGRVLMSPLAMAVVTAAVASGTPRDPRLVLDARPSNTAPAPLPSGSPHPTATPRPSPTPLPALQNANLLRALMFETVRTGTAHVLSMGGLEIGAKTGTAQYGSETQPGLHAWMVGFLGDIAFAVIVERGETGATTAGPLARTFLTQLRDYATDLRKP